MEAWGWDNIRWAMDRAGIKHDGLLRVTHKAPDNAETLGTHYSVSLPVMLAKMLKKSDNLYADTFLKTVGRHYYNKPGSYRSGTMAVRAILTKNGIDWATPLWPMAPASPLTISSAPARCCRC